jgi:hypothetical protein
MRESALYFPVGAAVGVPPAGIQGYFVDTDGVLKQIDSSGNKVPVSGSVVTAIAVGADATDVTIASNLNGDTDGGYEIVGTIVSPGASPGANYSIQVNGADPASCELIGQTIPTGGSVTGFFTNNLYINNEQATFSASITFRVVMGSLHGVLMQYEAYSKLLPAVGGTHTSRISIAYFNAAANITSISLHADTASAIKSGTKLWFRKRGLV